MIPVNTPLFQGKEAQYLSECIQSGWVSSEGPFVKRFEAEFSKYVGVPYGISVCNGTAAVEAGLYALGVGPGDEVIIPSMTIISCAIACIRLGATPVIVDVDPSIYTLNPALIESHITEKTKVIMPVHLYGHPVDMDPVIQIAKKHHLLILEDAAQAHGARYYSKDQKKWVSCGSMGDVATFSFYANKLITTGEGGMVVTSDKAFYDRAASYRNLCFQTTERFCHEELGYNFRMSNLQAAVGCAQLEQLDHFLDIKQRFSTRYHSQLDSLPGISLLPVHDWAQSNFWMFAVVLDSKSGLTAKKALDVLKEKKIGARPFFRGLHTQPVLLNHSYINATPCPVSDHGYDTGFYLPSGLGMTDSDVQFVCDQLTLMLN